MLGGIPAGMNFPALFFFITLKFYVMEVTKQNKELASELNKLVEINNDRIQGYKTALKETEDFDLKDLFKRMVDHSFNFKNQLADEILKVGGEPTQGTCTSGKVYRAWMDIRAALTKKDRKAIVSSCEYGEDAALERYEEVLKDDHLSLAVRNMVVAQKELLQQDHDSIKALRDSLKNT
jgi:uncharacterized protein (TIGR02284 family)